MKIKYIVALMTVIATAGGCTQDTGEQPEEAVPIRLAATIAPTDAGKTRSFGVWGGAATTQDTELLTGQTVRAWISENDGLHTAAIKDPIEYTVSNAAGDLEPVNTTTDPAFYYPQGVDVISIHAIHPSGYASGGTFTVNTDQTTEANYAASDLCYSMPTNFSRTDVDANGRKLLQMKHLLSKIVVNLTLDANVTGATLPTSIKLRANTSTTMTYPVAVTTDANGYTGCTPSDASDPGVITMKQEAIIPPQTIAAGASFISFSVTGLGPMIYPMPDATTFESGKRYTYNIRVKNVGIAVTTDVNDWGRSTDNQKTVIGKTRIILPIEYVGEYNISATSSDITNNVYTGATHRMATDNTPQKSAYFCWQSAYDKFASRVTIDGYYDHYHLPTCKEWMAIIPPYYTVNSTGYNVSGYFPNISGNVGDRIYYGSHSSPKTGLKEEIEWGARWNGSSYVYDISGNDGIFYADYYCPTSLTDTGYGLRLKPTASTNGKYTCAYRYQSKSSDESVGGGGSLTVQVKYVGEDQSITINTISDESWWTHADYTLVLPYCGRIETSNIDYPSASFSTSLYSTASSYGAYWTATNRSDGRSFQIALGSTGVLGDDWNPSSWAFSVRLFHDAD